MEAARLLSYGAWGGRVDVEVLAGAFRKPNGSFRLPVRRRIEPGE